MRTSSIYAVITTIFVALVCFLIFWGYPQYKIYTQRLDGEAILAKAEAERRVLVETAKAQKDAAILEAEAEIERAKGVAEAVKEDGLFGAFTGGLGATAAGITVAIVAALLAGLFCKSAEKG